MLLFLLSDNFRERPERPAAQVLGVTEIRAGVQASLLAGLFLTGWCLLRLAAPSQGRSLDLVLAVFSLTLGVGTVLRAARALSTLKR
jgi:hypothetical protein